MPARLGASSAVNAMPVSQGGTGATTAAAALTNLGAAPKVSPAFTGTPTTPTAAAGTNTTQVASTAFVAAAVSAVSGGGGGAAGPLTAAQFNNAFLNILTSGNNLTVSGFSTIVMPYNQIDGGGNYNNTTGIYTVPFTGTYMVMLKVRVNSLPAGNSYGFGVHTSNGDGPYFSWAVTNGQREGFTYFRVNKWTAGDQLRLFGYSDTSNTVYQGEMQIIPLSAG